MGSRGALEVSIKITAEWKGNRELRRGGPAGGDVAALERVGMKSWSSLLLATWLFLCLERRQHSQLAYSQNINFQVFPVQFGSQGGNFHVTDMKPGS